MRIGFLLLMATALYGQNSAGDWPMFNRDLAATRYSPLTQINAKNVSKLTRAWSYKLKSSGGTCLHGGSAVAWVYGPGVWASKGQVRDGSRRFRDGGDAPGRKGRSVERSRTA